MVLPMVSYLCVNECYMVAPRRREGCVRPAGPRFGSPRPREEGRGAPEAFARLTAAVRRRRALAVLRRRPEALG